MTGRFRQRVRFVLERWIQRGALNQLLLMLSLIVIVAFTGGLLAASATTVFGDLGAAVWWAFLRLTDPGYLGDDEGTALRVISTIVTVLGYVLFMGSLIAIMTQWLNQEIRKLESGLTPISIEDHFLILGWTNRTPSIVRELVLSEGRVRRFLKRRGARGLRIVILAEEVTSALRQELKDIVGKKLRQSQVIMRSGSSMRVEHLERVDFARASAIILPGADFAMGGPEATDTRIVKTLMSISRYDGRPGRDAPSVVAEIYDVNKLPIVEQAYEGTVNVIAGDSFISRLIVQTVRHRGLSAVYSELLSHEHGNEVYVRRVESFDGRPFASIVDNFPTAVLLGVVRPEKRGYRPILNPAQSFTIGANDSIVLIANSYENSLPKLNTPAISPEPAAIVSARPVETKPLRRILLLGWSHKVGALVTELDGYASERFEVDVLSLVSAAERQADLAHVEISPDSVTVKHIEGDYTRHADLEKLDWDSYDNMVFLGSDWLDSSAETDARSILGYSAVRAVLESRSRRPDILIELIDPSNVQLFKQRPGEVIISPVILSHMLAHAALRQELTSVFGELFGPGGAEIFFRSVNDYGLAGQTLSFRDVQRQAHAHGEVALGVRVAPAGDKAGGVALNPPPATTWDLGNRDEMVVLTRYS